MQPTNRFDQFLEGQLAGRYITMAHIQPLLDRYQKSYTITTVGHSEKGIPIPMITVGHGKKITLGWSQMHGNESTTTKGVFDFLSLIHQKSYFHTEIQRFLDENTLHIIPILNPDGALSYTRENANGVDLNRDAQQRSQAESKVLASVFESLQPDLCLNLHDQRTIYGVKGGKPATVSFLAPAADIKRKVTPSRKEAMKYIATMATVLNSFIPGQVGRYDDTYNEACVGDSFQKAGVPTILFEAGHFPDDYQREETRKYILYALLSLFGLLQNKAAPIAYNAIPKNNKKFRDVIIRNAVLDLTSKHVSIAIQMQEELQGSRIHFVPVIDEIGKLPLLHGHLEIDAQGATVLLNSQENFNVGDKVSHITKQNDNSLLYSLE